MTVIALLLLVAVALAVAGSRDLRVLFTAQVAALAANLALPFKPFGVAITSQRLVAVVVLGVCGSLYLRGRIVPRRLTAGQVAFTVAYGAILVIQGLHALLSPKSFSATFVLSALLNLVLFHLTLIVLQNLDAEDRRTLFHRWLPWAMSAVMLAFIASWAHDMMARPNLDLGRFQQTYRLRNTEARNIVNVWAASLVLAVPFVWQPLFGSARLVRKLASLLAVGLTALAIVLTFSRAALFGLGSLLLSGFGLAILGRLTERDRPGERDWLRVAAPVAGALVFAVAAGTVLELAGVPVISWLGDRVLPVFTGHDRSLRVRLSRFGMTSRLLQDLPLLGYGPGAEEVSRLPENTILFTTLYYGPLGLMAVVAMLAVIGWELVAWWWPRRQRPLASAWPATFLAYLFLLLTNDFLFFSPGTLVLATLTACISRHCEEEQFRGCDSRPPDLPVVTR